MIDCKTCILYDVFAELLSRLGEGVAEDLVEKLPKCNCEHHEPLAKAHHEYSDVAYYWDCPIHGKRTEAKFEEMLARMEG